MEGMANYNSTIMLANALVSGSIFYFILRALAGIGLGKIGKKPHAWGALIWLIVGGIGMTSLASGKGIGNEHIIFYFVIFLLPTFVTLRKRIKKSLEEPEGSKEEAAAT